MIFGEESMNVKFNKGLWESDAPEKTPDGFCSEFTNCLVDDIGNIVPRPAFVRCGQSTVIAQAYPNVAISFKPAYYGNFRHRKLGGYGTNNPDGWLNTETKLTNYKKSLSTDSTNSVATITGGHTFDWSTACMYRDRIYAFCSTDSAIKRLTGWSFVGASALTETTVGVTPTAISGMLFFKSRLFAWYQNRVMFTDEITAGGYPETWNTGTNFFDLPSDGSPTINNIFVIDNTMWAFTEDGVYTVLVYGAPSNWIVRKVNERIITTSKYDSCISSDNIIFFKTDESVFAFNREKIVEVGAPIKHVLQNRGSVGLVSAIFTSEKGLFLSVQQLGSGGTYYTLEGATTYYFNGNGWSKITYGSNTFLSISQCFASRDALALSNWSSSRITYISLLYGTAAGSLSSEFLYVAENNYAETMSCVFKVVIKDMAFRERRFKYGYLDIYSRLSGYFKTNISQGLISPDADEETYNLTPVPTDKNFLSKFKAPQLVKSFLLKFRQELTAGAAIVGTPPFQVKAVDLIVNTSRNVSDSV